MIKKESRLKKASEFRQVFKEGRRFTSPHFVLYVRANDLQAARIGVSIAKSHFKLAVRRNKLRRAAKGCFQREAGTRLRGYDFVVASRASYRSKNLKEALGEVKNFFDILNKDLP